MIDFIKKNLQNTKKTSYAQSGEDLIVDFIFSNIEHGKENGKYIDIGAHHPKYLNNTYLFYKYGWTGINIDPLKENISLFQKRRPKDLNICIGIGISAEEKDFFIMNPSTLSTFDKQKVSDLVEQGHSINKIEKIDFITVSNLISRYTIDNNIDILTIDIEGNELYIIKEFLDNAIYPKVLICETVFYTPKLKNAQKNKHLIEAISNLGYILYADTFINSIFVSERFWNQLEKP